MPLEPEHRAPAALVEAVSALWRLPPLGSGHPSFAPLFDRVRETCQSLYPQAGSAPSLRLALWSALRTFGLPCWPAPEDVRLAPPAPVAAARLDAAFRRTKSFRKHLCPLDLAADLPALSFGPNSIRKYTAAELDILVNSDRLKRFNRAWKFDAQRLSMFSWLVVSEDVEITREPGWRADPRWPMNFSRDFGQIEPHKERFPVIVEAALFALMLIPWEDWMAYDEADWRPFHIPWVYTVDDDAFVEPSHPPFLETLTWEPDTVISCDGESVEVERPLRPYVNHDSAKMSAWLNDSAWNGLANARQSSLFETPITHFVLRAFLSDGIDEFLAHMTAIEAALGQRSDYPNKDHPRRTHKSLRATARMAARVSGLLGAKNYGDDYEGLFDIRSAFLHGRTVNPISSRERILARRLARKVVHTLALKACMEPHQSRDVCLEELLDLGTRAT